MDAHPVFNKTRLAPTPSGFLHLGNVLSFAITATLARKYGAKILLRIDDMDRERAPREYVQDIFDTLNFLEIPWDEGPRDIGEYENKYSQLARVEVYNELLDQLREDKRVFACSCSRTQVLRNNEARIYAGKCREINIPLNAEGICWRLDTREERTLSVKTLQGGVTAQLPDTVQYFTVKKKDGLPGYQLATLADDIYFGVDLIVRGQDLWDSTLAQLYLAAVLEKPAFSNATFYHHPLLTEGGNKLSKSAGSTSIHYLRKEGKKSSDIFAIIAGMLQINEPVKTWQELGAAIV